MAGTIRCVCADKNADPCRFIAVTGGPGAGKTAVLELFRKNACARSH